MLDETETVSWYILYFEFLSILHRSFSHDYANFATRRIEETSLTTVTRYANSIGAKRSSNLTFSGETRAIRKEITRIYLHVDSRWLVLFARWNRRKVFSLWQYNTERLIGRKVMTDELIAKARVGEQESAIDSLGSHRKLDGVPCFRPNFRSNWITRNFAVTIFCLTSTVRPI